MKNSPPGLYTNFEICDNNFLHIVCRKNYDLPSQAIYVDKTNPNKSPHI